MTTQAISTIDTLHEGLIVLESYARNQRNLDESIRLFKSFILIAGPIIRKRRDTASRVKQIRQCDKASYIEPDNTWAYPLDGKPYGFVVNRNSEDINGFSLATFMGDPYVAVTVPIEQWVEDGFRQAAEDETRTPVHIMFARDALTQCIAIVNERRNTTVSV